MNKRGQEELVGFVVIVVLVAIIFLVLLAIFIRKPGTESKQESIEIYQFLEGAMKQTSECAISYEPNYLEVGELIEGCYDGKRCLDGEDTCKILNYTFVSLIDSSWNVGSDFPIKGYVFNSSYEGNATSKEIFNLEKGSCIGSTRGSEYISPAFPGTIVSTLRLCY